MEVGRLSSVDSSGKLSKGGKHEQKLKGQECEQNVNLETNAIILKKAFIVSLK